MPCCAQAGAPVPLQPARRRGEGRLAHGRRAVARQRAHRGERRALQRRELQALRPARASRPPQPHHPRFTSERPSPLRRERCGPELCRVAALRGGMPGAPMPSRGHCRSSDPRHTQHHTEGQRCSHHQRSDAHPSHRQVSGCSRSCTLGKLGQSSVTNGTVRAAESADPTEVCRRGAAARSGWRRGCPPTRWRRRAAALRQRWPAAWRMRTRACAWPRSRRWTRWCCR